MYSFGLFMLLVALLETTHGGEWKNYRAPAKGGQRFPSGAPLPKPTANDSPATNLQPPQFSPSGTQPHLSGNASLSTGFNTVPTSSLNHQPNSPGVLVHNFPGGFNFGAFPVNTASSASASASASSSAHASASSTSDAGAHGSGPGSAFTPNNLGSHNGHNSHPGSSATSSASASASATASASASASTFGGLHPSSIPSGNFNSNQPLSSIPIQIQGNQISASASASASSSVSSGYGINGNVDNSASASSSATGFQNGLASVHRPSGHGSNILAEVPVSSSASASSSLPSGSTGNEHSDSSASASSTVNGFDNGLDSIHGSSGHGSNILREVPVSSSASASSSVSSGSPINGQSDSAASASSSATSSDNGSANIHKPLGHGSNNFGLLSGQGGFNAINFPTSNHASSSASASSDTDGHNGSASASASSSASARPENLSPGFHALVNGLNQGHSSPHSSNTYNVKGR